MSVTVLQKNFVYKKQAVSQVWAVGHTYLTSGLKYILSLHNTNYWTIKAIVVFVKY